MEVRTPPAMYNPSRSFGILVMLLRSVLILFTLIAFSVMAANKETFYEAYAGVDYTLKFSAVKAFVGLLSLDIIICFYAIVQLALCFMRVTRTGAFVSSPTTSDSLLNFIFDTMLAYTLIAATGAAANDLSLAVDWDDCDSVPGFCQKAKASIAISFFSFAILAALAAVYPVRLLRLSK